MCGCAGWRGLSGIQAAWSSTCGLGSQHGTVTLPCLFSAPSVPLWSGAIKNPPKVHKSCLYTGPGRPWGGESAVRLQGACLGGRGKDGSWRVATRALGERREGESAGPLGFRRSSRGGALPGGGHFPEGGPVRQPIGEPVESKLFGDIPIQSWPGVGGRMKWFSAAERPRHQIVVN